MNAAENKHIQKIRIKLNIAHCWNSRTASALLSSKTCPQRLGTSFRVDPQLPFDFPSAPFCGCKALFQFQDQAASIFIPSTTTSTASLYLPALHDSLIQVDWKSRDHQLTQRHMPQFPACFREIRSARMARAQPATRWSCVTLESVHHPNLGLSQIKKKLITVSQLLDSSGLLQNPPSTPSKQYLKGMTPTPWRLG